MESILLMSHSALRYILVILLACSLIVAYGGMIRKKSYVQGVQKLHQITRSLLGLQMLLGLTLYFLLGFYHHFGQGENLPEQIAFFSTGHIIGMLLGITLINIGYGIAMKARTDKGKYLRIAIFYSIGSLIIFICIPWPFLFSWARWF